MDDLETVVANSIAGVRELRDERDALAQRLDTSERTCAKLEAENSTLREQLRELGAKADYHMRWNAEIVTQVNNIGMFVTDAMTKAKIGPYRGNAQAERVALAAVDDALDPVPKFLTLADEGERRH